MNLKEWEESGKTFKHNGYSTFFREEGEGRELLLLHGFPTASYDWKKIWPELSGRFHLIAPDYIGYGFSEKPRNYSYSVFDHADQVERLLLEKGIRECGILAHDYGDTVAQELLARHNERKLKTSLRYLCFLNGGIFPEVHHPILVQKLLLSPIGWLISNLLNEKSFSKNFSSIFGSNTKPDVKELNEFWSLVERSGGKEIYHRLIRYIPERRMNRERWVGALLKTSVPLRFINGGADPISGSHMAQRYRELVRSPDTVILENIGHYPQVEDPQGILRAFLAFADRV